jgi:hypothetical protein
MLLIDYEVGVYQICEPEGWIGEHCQCRTFWRSFNDLCKVLTACAECCKQGLPTLPYLISLSWGFDCMARDDCIPDYGDYDFSDLAIMFYYYRTHRQPLNPVEYENGMTE